ncbi:MAG TPA: dTMP kinase [Deltaproteobacteria bacterium]|nr:dTMP kinase [Deltaproteobacteria bacterium]
MGNGAFVSFEGIDGCGKSTQLERAADWLEAKGLPVLRTREPGGTPIGRKIREVLLDPENGNLCPDSELLLYLADRIQHLQEVILPAKASGTLVLCDRFHDSAVAYQGYGRGLDLTATDSIVQHHITPNLPDLTLWLDLPPGMALERLKQSRDTSALDRLDSETLRFFKRARAGFAAQAKTNPERFVRLDGVADIEILHQQIVTCFQERIL